MKYPPYPSYKRTRTQWLGEVPSHWITQPLWSMFHREKTVGMPDEELLSVFRDYGVIPKSQRENLNKTAENRDIYQFVDTGWLVTNRMKAWQGSVGISPQRGIVSGHYIVFRPIHQADDGFLNLLMRSDLYTLGYQTLSRGVRPGQAEIDNDQYRTMAVLLPPIEEQKAIVRWVNSETAQIDELIGKQNALIELLSERLDRIWSVAVERLSAEYPVASLRHAVSSIVDGPFGSSLTSAHYSDEGAGVVRLGNIGIDEFKLADRAFIPLDYAATLSAHAVRPGDVVVAGLGDEKMPLGRAAIVPGDFGVGIVKADCYRVRPATGISPEYLSWILSAPQSRSQFKAISRGSTRQRLNTRVVQELRIPLPTPEAQKAAIGDFRAMREAHGELTRKAVQVVNMLHERRSALITAAVTGKIDTRGAA